MTSLGDFLQKWWLPAISYLLASSPSALVLIFQDTLIPQVSALEPQKTLNLIAALLLLVLVLLAFIILHQPWLKWDEPTGTWLNRLTKLRYCAKCKAAKIVTPLKNEVTGWRCMNCQHFFHDPARANIEPRLPKVKNGRI